MNYHHLFGPVASRRLGVSLGVDLVVHKVCSLNCVYCECGKTTDLTTERKAWVPFERVRAELDHYWAHNDDPDYITFSGSGEPTLNTDIGRVIAYIREKKPGIRVAVLTNGTLLGDAKVRADLALADLVVPSLDAVSASVFERINRPASPLDPAQMIDGIREFVKGFSGKVHLEIFILPGVNDTPEELALLRGAIDRIQPHLVQLNALDRPGTEPGIETASRENLERIRKVLGPDRTEIIARGPRIREDRQKKASRKTDDLESAILETIFRRPCTCQDLSAMLGAEAAVVQGLLDRLVTRGRVTFGKEQRGFFYQTVKEDRLIQEEKGHE